MENLNESDILKGGVNMDLPEIIHFDKSLLVL